MLEISFGNDFDCWRHPSSYVLGLCVISVKSVVVRHLRKGWQQQRQHRPSFVSRGRYTLEIPDDLCLWVSRVCSSVLSLHALSSLFWHHLWLNIFNLMMDYVRTHDSVDETRVASEICCHLRAICGRAAPGYRTTFGRTLALKRRNEGAKNGLRRRRGQWSHGGYSDGVATREDKSIVYRGILTLRPKIQHRCIGRWGSENCGVSRQCQGPCTSRQTEETGASFSYHVRVTGLRLFPI